MLSWCIKRRAAVLGATAGVLLVALVVYRIAPASGKAVRKAARPLSIPGPVKPEAAPPPVVPTPLPPYSPMPMAGFIPPAPVVPPVLDFASKSIDQLLNDLDVLRTKKGEMDTLEKKVVAVLRQKLADQEQRLRKHGLMPGDTPACCAAPSAGAPTTAAR